MYNELKNIIHQVIVTLKGSITLYMRSTDDNLELKALCVDYYDFLYKHENEKVINTLEIINGKNRELSLMLIFNTYNSDLESEMFHILRESKEDEDELEMLRLRSNLVSSMGMMKHDTNFNESVSGFKNINMSLLIEGIANEDLNIDRDIILTEGVKAEEIVYVSPHNSVNRFFEDAIYSDVFSEENRAMKQLRQQKLDIVEESVLSHALDTVLYSIDGDMFEESVNDMNNIINSRFKDDDIMYEFTNDGDQTKVIKRSATDLGETGTEEKPGKPRMADQSLASKLQQKGLDADVKMQKTLAKGGRASQTVKNTVKAIMKVPTSIVNSFKSQIKEWDDMDDNRRKEYIIKPGNRKKVFNSFRLALFYYLPLAAAGGGLAGLILKAKILPVLFVYRHFSKDKNKRIRNELAMELDTEIKLCEEKVADANANNNRQAKYQLMRIRDKLVAERTRVRTNSKYV